MKKILPVSEEKIFNSYLVTGLPASILLGQSHLYGYYLENYIQALCCLDLYDDLEFSISDALDYVHPEVMDKTVIDIGYRSADFISQLSGKQAIKEYIIENIEEGNYIIAYMDEYYITGREAEQKHFIHESLIYGFDNDFFYVLNFASDGIYKSQKWNINDVIKSIYNGVDYSNERLDWISKKYITIYYIKKKDEYIAKKEIILNKIEDYFKAVEIYSIQTDLDMVYSAYGINCADLMIRYIDYLIKLIDDQQIQSGLLFEKMFAFYCVIKHFIDHKKGINERIAYLTSNDAAINIRYHKEVIELADILCVKLLKTRFFCNQNNKMKQSLLGIRTNLYELKQREYYVLKKFLGIIN